MSARGMFEPGDRIGPYEIQSRLRAGGMATLFLGRRHGAAGVSRLVVIKVIHPHLADEERMTKMFIDEARISSRISHSNVVYVEQFGEHERVYYMVMEYVDGCSVEQLLKALVEKDKRIDAALAVHLVIEAAAGLHAAHETRDEDGTLLGIVHRDISPSNILLGRDGRIKVIDFGIAKASGRLGETGSGDSLKGKVRYMSPEQAWGLVVDRRSDVYATGVVLWELLTRKGLFRGSDDLAVLELVRNPRIPPPSEIVPTIPHELDRVVARATARSPEDRYPTMAELRADLSAAMPDAVKVSDDQVAALVAMVRETFPSPLVDATPRLSTPRSGTSPTAAEANTQRSPIPQSVRSANGQVTAHPVMRARWVVLGGIGIAVIGGVTASLVMGMRSSSRDEAADVRSSSIPPTLPVAPPLDAGIAVAPPITIDAATAAVAPPIDAGTEVTKPAVVTTKPHVTTGKRPGNTTKPNTKPAVEAVEADGAVLADDHSSDVKPPPKPDKK
jgi:serine/threonine-protein kinase